MRYVLLSLTCLIALAPGTRADDVPPKKERAAMEPAIRESLFRYLFDNNRSALKKDANFYFLSLDKEESPSEAFMKRFDEHEPPVKPVSECVKDADVKDKATGKRGLLFHVRKITWISDTEVHVVGGYYEGNLSASGGPYRIDLEEGKWVVKGPIGLHPIS